MKVLSVVVCTAIGTYIGRWLVTRSRRKKYQKDNKSGV